MKSLRILSAAAALVVSACAPLQQAPLLYSSKTTVGLDVSTSTTETPGGSISIGVKIVDAAYVPVAVSKHLRDGKTDTDIASEIVLIQAGFGEGSTTARLDSLTDENKEKIAAYLTEKIKEDKLSAEVRALERSIARNTAKRDKAQNMLKSPAAAAAASATDAQKELLSAARSDLEEASAQLLRETKVLPERRASLELARDRSAQALATAAEATALLRTERRDALSVYGRFNTESAANAASSPSASLTAGKIFSTGVASQNLTEAVRKESEAVAVTRCLDSLHKLLEGLPADKRAELLGRFESLCGTKARGPVGN